MLDFPLMLQVTLPVIDRIQLKSSKFAIGAENKATGDLKLINSPDLYPHILMFQEEPYRNPKYDSLGVNASTT